MNKNNDNNYQESSFTSEDYLSAIDDNLKNLINEEDNEENIADELFSQKNNMAKNIAENINQIQQEKFEQFYSMQAKIDAYQASNQQEMRLIEKNMELIQILQEKQTQSFEQFMHEQKIIQNFLQQQQEKQMVKAQKEHMIIHDAYQKPLKNFIIELNNIYQKSKVIYYKPFLIHGLFFLVMACLIASFASIYINEIKRQRELNQQELVLIQQSKKGHFSQCGENSRLCVKVERQKFYGKNGEYAVIVP